MFSNLGSWQHSSGSVQTTDACPGQPPPSNLINDKEPLQRESPKLLETALPLHWTIHPNWSAVWDSHQPCSSALVFQHLQVLCCSPDFGHACHKIVAALASLEGVCNQIVFHDFLCKVCRMMLTFPLLSVILSTEDYCSQSIHFHIFLFDCLSV